MTLFGSVVVVSSLPWNNNNHNQIIGEITRDQSESSSVRFSSRLRPPVVNLHLLHDDYNLTTRADEDDLIIRMKQEESVVSSSILLYSYDNTASSSPPLMSTNVLPPPPILDLSLLLSTLMRPQFSKIIQTFDLPLLAPLTSFHLLSFSPAAAAVVINNCSGLLTSFT